MATQAPETRILVKDVRLSYFHGITPYASERDLRAGKEPTYQTRALLPRDRQEDVNRINRIIELAKRQKWGDNPPPLSEDKYFIRKGPKARPQNPEYQDMWVLALNAQRDKPKLILPDKSPATSEHLYSGVWAHVIFTIWCQSDANGKRVNAKWNAAMFSRHDEHLAGAPPIDDSEWDDALQDDWSGEDSAETIDSFDDEDPF